MKWFRVFVVFGGVWWGLFGGSVGAQEPSSKNAVPGFPILDCANKLYSTTVRRTCMDYEEFRIFTFTLNSVDNCKNSPTSQTCAELKKSLSGKYEKFRQESKKKIEEETEEEAKKRRLEIVREIRQKKKRERQQQRKELDQQRREQQFDRQFPEPNCIALKQDKTLFDVCARYATTRTRFHKEGLETFLICPQNRGQATLVCKSRFDRLLREFEQFYLVEQWVTQGRKECIGAQATRRLRVLCERLGRIHISPNSSFNIRPEVIEETKKEIGEIKKFIQRFRLPSEFPIRNIVLLRGNLPNSIDEQFARQYFQTYFPEEFNDWIHSEEIVNPTGFQKKDLEKAWQDNLPTMIKMLQKKADGIDRQREFSFITNGKLGKYVGSGYEFAPFMSVSFWNKPSPVLKNVNFPGFDRKNVSFREWYFLNFINGDEIQVLPMEETIAREFEKYSANYTVQYTTVYRMTGEIRSDVDRSGEHFYIMAKILRIIVQPLGQEKPVRGEGTTSVPYGIKDTVAFGEPIEITTAALTQPVRKKPVRTSKKNVEGGGKKMANTGQIPSKSAATLEDSEFVREHTESKKVVVKKGDSLSKIAQRYGIDYRDLARENNIDPHGVIHPGKELNIPFAGQRRTAFTEHIKQQIAQSTKAKASNEQQTPIGETTKPATTTSEKTSIFANSTANEDQQTTFWESAGDLVGTILQILGGIFLVILILLKVFWKKLKTTS